MGASVRLEICPASLRTVAEVGGHSTLRASRNRVLTYCPRCGARDVRLRGRVEDGVLVAWVISVHARVRPRRPRRGEVATAIAAERARVPKLVPAGHGRWRRR